MTQRRSTAAETAALFRGAFEARMDRKANGRPWQCRQDSVDLDYLRERLLVKVGRLTPKWSSQLHREVEDDLGDICVKRVKRCLKWLLEHGEISRTPDGYLLAPRPKRVAQVGCSVSRSA